MFGFIKKKIVETSHAAAIKEIQSFRQLASVAADDEASAMLVATAVAARQLKTTELISRVFPEAYLHGTSLADTPTKQGELSLYVLDVVQMHQAAKGSDHGLSQFAAVGYAVLIHSLRAVGRSPQMLIEGRLLWRELLRGLPGYASTYREFVNPKVTEEQLSLDLFVPRMLAPEVT